MVRRMMVLLFTSICIFGWTPAYAQEGKGSHGRPEMSGDSQSRPPRPMNAGDMLGKAMNEQIAAQVMSELTGKSVSVAEISGGTFRDILKSSGIQPDAFKTAMDAKSTAMIQKAVGCGLITDSQASDMIQKMQNAPKADGPPPAK